LEEHVLTASAETNIHDIGIEVLTIGNNNYSLLGLQEDGKLKNAVADAEAVAEAFRKLGARVQTHRDVQDVDNLESVVNDWAEARLSHDTQGHVRVVFVFWAGHAFHCKQDGLTHVVPTGNGWDIRRMKPGRSTMAVKDIIHILREKSKKSKLILCLDSCRTEMNLEVWTNMRRDEQGGPDSQSHNGVEIWYSTAHGEVARDGVGRHSHFTESILSCLQVDISDLYDKTFDDIWKDINKEMQRRDPAQLPSQYKSGVSEHETLLPRLVVVQEKNQAENNAEQVIVCLPVCLHVHTSCKHKLRQICKLECIVCTHYMHPSMGVVAMYTHV
jgi:hypothetical protein